MAVTIISFPSKNSFISWKARCGFTGTSSKSVFLRSVERSSATRSTQGPGSLSEVMSRAACTIACRASLASEITARSGGNTRPIWRGSMSTWMNCLFPRVPLRPAVADTHHQVALQEEGVGKPLLGLQAHDAHEERVVVGDGALAH